jgi:hypothetical protein
MRYGGQKGKGSLPAFVFHHWRRRRLRLFVVFHCAVHVCGVRDFIRARYELCDDDCSLVYQLETQYKNID